MKRLRHVLRRWCDPVEQLKREVRDLEDQLPERNERLALLQAHVTLAGKDLARAREAAAPVQELARLERMLATATAAFEAGRQAKEAFLAVKDEKRRAVEAVIAVRRLEQALVG